MYCFRRDHKDIGPNDRTTIKALTELARARGRLGGTPADRWRHLLVARRYLLAARAKWRLVGRPDDMYRLDPLEVLSINSWMLKRFADAVEAAGELYQGRKEILGESHSDTIDALENLLIFQEASGRELSDSFQTVLLMRLRSQGAGHADLFGTLGNLVRFELAHIRSESTGSSNDGASGSTRGSTDPEELKARLVQDAAELQQRRVDSLGPDDPRTCVATAYLAHALALTDDVEGQLDQASALIDDALAGLHDASADGDDRLGRCDLETAKTVHAWIARLIDQRELEASA
ncbi:hypothetical protein GCM10029992_08010 [Glycomyces albus]